MSLTKQQRIKRRELFLTLYALERKYGISADLYSVNDVDPNYELGRPDQTVTKYHINKLITNNVTILQEIPRLLGESRSFRYGDSGVYNPGDRLCVVRNVFGLSEIKMQDYLVYDSKRYSMQRVVALDFQAGWLLHIRHTPDVKAYQIFDKSVWSRVTPSQEVDNEL